MAPVGSYESLMAAIQGGADAVYFGIGQLNMRSRSSQNFSLSDLQKISSICSDNHIRSYITLNSVIYNNELNQMRRIADAAKENQITAIIASDLAVIQYAHSKGIEVHISTQCNISNIEAVKFFAHFADVMVTARELRLEQVAVITRTIEKERITGPSGNLVSIEVFAHGALCMAISGKCYLSLDNFNQSANRGECLQPCRRLYIVKDKDKEVELEIDNEYIMSPKDLNTIGFLDKILEAGVKVLKIEGRGRSPEYVKTVTKCYREAVNAFYDGTYTEENIKIWNDKLSSVYNRGFWDGYYLGRKMGEWTEKYGSRATNKKLYIGKVTNYFTNLKVAEVKIETHDLQINDQLYIIGPTTGVVECDVNEIRVELKNVDKAIKGEICSIPVEAFLRRSDKLYKVVDAGSMAELDIDESSYINP